MTLAVADQIGAAHALQGLAQQTHGGGTIVNVGSTASNKGYPGGSAYAGSKFGGIGLTQSFALELVADRGTRRGFADGRVAPGRLMRLAMEAGLICYPGGIEVDGAAVPHIMLAPPMILEESHMEECCDKLATVLDQALHA
mgnify:CR=1 FL=1